VSFFVFNIHVLNYTGSSFLSSFEKLTELHLFMIQNGDITPLKTLKHLETLELYGIECTDYATLSELPALKKLNLSRSNLSDLSLISGLRDLEALDISYTSIHDLSDIGSFPHLTWLSFGKYYALDEDITYSGLEALQSLHYLETLEINGFRSFDPAFLAGISSLKCVNFQDTDFINEEALSNLTNLETLVIWDSDFSDPSCLTSLSDLHYLSLYGCAISDYSSLAEMTNLGILTIYDDSIAVYSGEPVYQLSEEQSALLVASLKNTYLQLNEIEYHESISWSSDDRLDDPFTGAGNFY
ncbi:MAG: hypothetical protein Q4B09_11870, partial [Lachnospiraceae bacterium]|nr:hypothetical protein [Lachnospiraceae bacterium]